MRRCTQQRQRRKGRRHTGTDRPMMEAETMLQCKCNGTIQSSPLLLQGTGKQSTHTHTHLHDTGHQDAVKRAAKNRRPTRTSDRHLTALSGDSFLLPMGWAASPPPTNPDGLCARNTQLSSRTLRTAQHSIHARTRTRTRTQPTNLDLSAKEQRIDLLEEGRDEMCNAISFLAYPCAQYKYLQNGTSTLVNQSTSL